MLLNAPQRAAVARVVFSFGRNTGKCDSAFQSGMHSFLPGGCPIIIFAELQSGIHSSSRGPFTGHFKYVIMHRVYDDMLPSLYDRTNTEALTFKLISWMHKLSIVLNDKSRSKQVVMFSSLLRSWILSLCDWLHSWWSAVVSGKLYSIRCLTPAPVCCRIPSLRY